MAIKVNDASTGSTVGADHERLGVAIWPWNVALSLSFE
jgi:hypothetical protein